jgi:hypothetical protein
MRHVRGLIFSSSPSFFLTKGGVLMGEKFLKLSSVILSVASIVPWRLVYAFIEKEECAKEEEACRQSWKIMQISYCAGRA